MFKNFVVALSFISVCGLASQNLQAGTSGGIVVPDARVVLPVGNTSYITELEGALTILAQDEFAAEDLVNDGFFAPIQILINAEMILGAPNNVDYIHVTQGPELSGLMEQSPELLSTGMKVRLNSGMYHLSDVEVDQTTEQVSGYDQFGNKHWILPDRRQD